MQLSRCPTCGSSPQVYESMRRFENTILDLFHTGQLIKRDSCILCVEKHIGKAYALYKELLTADLSNMDSKTKIKVELNHLEIIGNLQAAFDEAQDWNDLYDLIVFSERRYRYEAIEPDWEQIASKIIGIKENVKKS